MVMLIVDTYKVHMEKVTRSFYEKLPRTILYVDDIAGIVDILSTASESVKIVTPDYRFDRAEELLELASIIGKKEIYDLDIISSKPYVKISLRQWTSEAYLGEDSLVLRGVLDKIRSILKSRQRRFAWLALQLFPGLLAGVGIILLLGLSLLSVGIPVMACGILYYIWAYRIERYRYCIIRLKNKSAESSFVERNRDEIIVAAITAILSAAATYILTKLLGG